MLATIPAFYLQFAGTGSYYQRMGAFLYLAVAIALAGHSIILASLSNHPRLCLKHNWSDVAISLGAFFSFSSSPETWSIFEWTLRMGLVGLILLRLIIILVVFLFADGHIYLLGLSVIGLALSVP